MPVSTTVLIGRKAPTSPERLQPVPASLDVVLAFLCVDHAVNDSPASLFELQRRLDHS